MNVFNLTFCSDEEDEIFTLWIRLVSLNLFKKGILSKDIDVIFCNGLKYKLPFLNDLMDFVRLEKMSSEVVNKILPELRSKINANTSKTRFLSDTPSGGIIDWPSSFLRCKHPYILGKFHVWRRQINHDLPENRTITQILVEISEKIERVCNNMRTFYRDSTYSLPEILKLRKVLNDVLQSAPFYKLKKDIKKNVFPSSVSCITELSLCKSKALVLLADWYKRFSNLNFISFNRFSPEWTDKIPKDNAAQILVLLLMVDAISSHCSLKDNGANFLYGELFKAVTSDGMSVKIFFNRWPLNVNPPKIHFTNKDPEISVRISNEKKPPHTCGILFTKRIIGKPNHISSVRMEIKRYLKEFQNLFPKRFIATPVLVFRSSEERKKVMNSIQDDFKYIELLLDKPLDIAVKSFERWFLSILKE